ncbi:MAG: type II toxin-antitoxin system RelE/ParE family toxin [Deferribacteraceae bacterium]|nr:type II toxin-antitoxin system RelE/ParE family toxin [Deferribacteraceae bacterium]
MVYRIHLTPKALKHIDLICDYITTELYNPKAAFNLTRLIHAKIKRLRIFPTSCPLISKLRLSDKETRKLTINRNIIVLYDINEYDKIVRILGVYNTATNYP